MVRIRGRDKAKILEGVESFVKNHVKGNFTVTSPSVTSGCSRDIALLLEISLQAVNFVLTLVSMVFNPDLVLTLTLAIIRTIPLQLCTPL